MSLPLRKKIIFYLILVCCVWIFTEGVFFAAGHIFFGNISSLRSEREQIVLESADHQDSNILQEERKSKKNWNVIHPFLGYVTEGINRNHKCPDQDDCDQRLRTYDDFPFPKSTDDNLLVAIIGGSFAGGVSYGSSPGLVEHFLKKVPRFQGKKITVYHLAAGGYKQPQQLLKINYFLSLGAEFDVIINIDGFNEIALPGVENLSKGVHPVFPRNWYYYVDTALNPQLLALYGKRENYRLERFGWANFFSTPLINFLPSTNVLWKFWNTRLTNKIKMADVELVQYKESKGRKLQYATTGPDYHFSTWDAFYEDMAGVWARCSLQLYNLCRSQGIEYFHFLQPNQYVDGSKPMLADEKKIALSNRSMYGKAAGEGYPFLIQRGKWLRKKGVPFYDLTMMFSDNARQLYIDDCCHLNLYGYNLVVEEITGIIRKYKAGENQ